MGNLEGHDNSPISMVLTLGSYMGLDNSHKSSIKTWGILRDMIIVLLAWC